MSTYGTILSYAFSRNSKLVRSTSGPGALIDEATEGVAIINRALRGLWTFGVSVNPEFFASAPQSVPGDGLGWPRPVTAQAVFLVEKTNGRIAIARVEERLLFTARAAVFQLGSVFYPCWLGPNSPHPDPAVGTGDALDFYFARFPVLGANLAASVDGVWPETFDDLLANEVAVRLLLKDGRIEEAQSVAGDRNEGLTLFAAFLREETLGMIEFVVRDSRRKPFNVAGLALPPGEEKEE